MRMRFHITVGILIFVFQLKSGCSAKSKGGDKTQLIFMPNYNNNKIPFHFCIDLATIDRNQMGMCCGLVPQGKFYTHTYHRFVYFIQQQWVKEIEFFLCRVRAKSFCCYFWPFDSSK